jgi:polysaccharide export outer membrane protein
MKPLLNWIFVTLALLVSMSAHAAGEYTLSTGDLVRVTVYDHPDLATETRVTERGSMMFPLIGEVPVSGASASEAAHRIAKLLEDGGFIKNPQVNAVIVDYRGQEVSVLGQVNRPGKFPLQKASRLTDVLALAGGATPNSGDSLILITNREGRTERREIDLDALFRDGKQALNLEVANNDILYVPRESRFYIYGEVQRPGTFRLERDMTVVQALSVGGGLTQRGTQKGMKILRRNAEGKISEIEARLSDQLLADDVIHVKESLF